jgi:hypothetical protein
LDLRYRWIAYHITWRYSSLTARPQIEWAADKAKGLGMITLGMEALLARSGGPLENTTGSDEIASLALKDIDTLPLEPSGSIELVPAIGFSLALGTKPLRLRDSSIAFSAARLTNDGPVVR